MFTKWGMAAKLSLLVGLLVGATVLVGGYGVHAVRQAQEANVASLQVQRDLKDTLNSARAAGTSFRLQILEFRHLLLRGHDKGDYDRFLGSFNKRTEDINRQFTEVQQVMTRAGLPADGVEDARRLHASISGQYLEALKLLDAEKLETLRQVDDAVRGKDRQLEDKIENLVNALQIHADSEASRVVDLSVAESRKTVGVLGGAVLVLAVVAALLGFLIIRQLRVALGGEPAYAREVASRIAGGDLATEVHVGRRDSDSVLAAIKKMQEELQLVVGDVVTGARAVADASAQIAQGNQDLSRRTEQQASTLEETASAMEELASTVTGNAESAREASRLAADAAKVAARGGEMVGQVVRTMSGISESSSRIADIIGVIDGIAFQTNILALNAAVEAARAGEQGRGFAVVAAEVRNLAQRSAAAAREIKTLIGESVDKVDNGARLVSAAGRTMEEIVGSVGKVSALIEEIAAASQEQNTGLQQVSAAVGQLELVVQQNASMVEEATAATEAMRDQADSLVNVVARFRLNRAARELAPADEPTPEAGNLLMMEAGEPRPRPQPAALAG